MVAWSVSGGWPENLSTNMEVIRWAAGSLKSPHANDCICMHVELGGHRDIDLPFHT